MAKTILPLYVHDANGVRWEIESAKNNVGGWQKGYWCHPARDMGYVPDVNDGILAKTIGGCIRDLNQEGYMIMDETNEKFRPVLFCNGLAKPLND